MPVDMLARGTARITLENRHTKTIYYAPDLRRRNKRHEVRGKALLASNTAQRRSQAHSFELLDEDAPFGWAPSNVEMEE